MIRLARKLRIRTEDERGITLAELMVAVTLFGILSAIVVGTFAMFSRTFNQTRSATDNTQVAAVGMNEITRVVRSGTSIEVAGQSLNDPAFLSASQESVLMYAFLDTDSFNPAPILVRFSINTNRELVETRWLSTKVSGYYRFPETTAAPSSTKVVARQIVTRAAGEPWLFSYLTSDGSELAIPAGGFTKDALRTIAAVRVSLKIQSDPARRAAPVLLQNSVGIPNLGISRLGQ